MKQMSPYLDLWAKDEICLDLNVTNDREYQGCQSYYRIYQFRNWKLWWDGLVGGANNEIDQSL